jgi:hypothetical protein
VNPGNDTITFHVRGATASRNADGIASYPITDTVVTGCFLQDTALSDRINNTEFAESTHRCISPPVAAVIACKAEDTLTDVDGVHYRIQGKRTYRTWTGRLDHITVFCQAQSG